MKISKKQKGFTIIELVVVILLLGILTATALPRFIDVTDDAHAAVVSSVLGGLGTSSAMFKAQWYADNQARTITTFGDMRANTAGYPVGLKSGSAATLLRTVATSANCKEIFENLLQGAGQPTIAALTEDTDAITAMAGNQSLPTTSDFVAYLNSTDSGTQNICYYIYTGQYTNITTNAIPVISYNAKTGAIAKISDI
jgi:MSHA pilin protein MshB